ncbi:MAG: sigma 54-interacting transcriptional regulator, partial [Myxococcota bacterium]
NYPNPGMPDRPGLIGEANGGTLFLDEFGQLPLESQSRLLRVLDDGEYSRLGESRSRRADLRLVAATNQPLDDLKHDVLARLPLRLTTPPLQDRREDIGLLITHLLRRIASDEPALSDRIFDGAAPHITARLVAALAAHPYRTHLRELSMLLWDALAAAPPGGPIDLPRGYADRLSAVTSFQTGTVAPSELSPEVIQAALDRHDGRQDPTWRELGLSSRYVLRRLVDKHGLRVRRRSSSGSSDDGG